MLNTLPYPLLSIFARSYALDKEGTENDLLRLQELVWSDGCYDRGSILLSRGRLGAILGRLKAGSLSVEEEYGGIARADDKKTVAVQGEDKPHTA
jgi:hypothetical protein